MKGKFRSAWIREASRAGSKESVKFAEARSASLDNGGRPCLPNQPSSAFLCFLRLYHPFYVVLTLTSQPTSGGDEG
jgi:hypothetical protein